MGQSGMRLHHAEKCADRTAIFRDQCSDPVGCRRRRWLGAQRWLAFQQAKALGGNVRKGERGTTVCYADRFTPKREQ